jgi:hypothetical protein
MNGILATSFRAAPDSSDVYSGRLEVALRALKWRLQVQYEHRFPGEAERIRQAIIQAERSAWHTDFPHLFLPDLVEEAIRQLFFASKSEHKDEISKLEHVASGVL